MNSSRNVSSDISLSFPKLSAVRHLHTQRSWLPWGYTRRLRVEIALSFPGALALLAQKFIALLPASLWDARQESENLKGRDGARLLEGSPLRDPPHDQELLWCAGHVVPSVEQGAEGERECFSCLVSSSFKEFRGNSGIAFDRKITLFGPFQGLEPTFVATHLPSLIPLELETFRLGIERFSSRHLSSLFGLSPQVDQTLTIEANSTQMLIEAEHQGLKNATDLPFHGDALWQGLERVLQECCYK